MTQEKKPSAAEVEVVDAEDEDVPAPTTFDLDDAMTSTIWPEVVDSLSSESSSRDLVISDPLERYLAEIRRFPSLSREEEHELAVKYYKEGDQVAAYKLVLANLRLVVLIAREYQKNLRSILDLIQEGNIGLLEAVKQYDPYRGIRFPSYAVYWIRAYMLRYLIRNIRLVKVGTTQAQRKLFFNLQKEKDKLEAEGFVPEAKLLAQRLNVKESEVIEMEQRLGLPDVSVDAPVSSQDERFDWHSILADKQPSVEDAVAREDFQRALRQAIDAFRVELDDKESEILNRRLFTDEPETLQAIAEDFQLSRERIRQIEARLKTRLKEYLQRSLELTADGDIAEEGSDT